jgi:type III pantothenate kinase
VILELDCGNTRIKWRLRNVHLIHAKGALLTADGIELLVWVGAPNHAISRVLVSSVLDDEYHKKIITWSLSCFKLNPEFAISEPYACGLSNGYQQPEKLGVDRWLAMLAARSQWAGACVVVDCGSAITVDVVTSHGEHIGGYIASGLRLMREALNTNTTAIKLTHIGYPEDTFPGRNTVAAIKAAELAMLMGLIDHAKAALRHYEKTEPRLLITGGDGEWLSSVLTDGFYKEDLVLDGLSIALAD